MNLALLSIRRPIFIVSVVLLIIVAGISSFFALPVDLNPKVEIPYVVVMTDYPGAGPREVESIVTKPLEEALISLEGIKRINSVSMDSMSQIELEFHLGSTTDTIEQKVRDRVSRARVDFPTAVKESSVEKFELDSMPVFSMSVSSTKLNRVQLTDWIVRELKPLISQVPKIGRIQVAGGLEREVHVLLDSKKLADYRMPLLTVSDSISKIGQNIPGGTIKKDGQEVNVRSLGEYSSLEQVAQTLVSFSSGESGVRVSDLGTVVDSQAKEESRAYQSGEQVIVVDTFKQSGANVIATTDALKKKIAEISLGLKGSDKEITITPVRDNSKEIRDNVWDVQESILIGIALTIVVVFLFLGSFKSTLITSLALPNSLIGAFILMYLFGFSINVMTLLALSVTVGLLIDDAIVVRENIYKHHEEGKSALRAALDGTNEVKLAVIATTFAIVAVFGPVGFLQGEIGQFFKEFGLTICFAMLISLFDALTIAPMLSAYWAHKESKGSAWVSETIGKPFLFLAKKFDRLQVGLERYYEKINKKLIAKPIATAVAGIVLCIALFGIAPLLPISFTPDTENPEFTVNLAFPAGTSLADTDQYSQKVLGISKSISGVKDTLMTVGNSSNEVNKTSLTVFLKASSERTQTPNQIREMYRAEIEKLHKDFPRGTEVSVWKPGQWQKPFNVKLLASSAEEAREFGNKLFERLKKEDFLRDVEISSKLGKPEMTIKVDSSKATRFGISEALVGSEVRGRIEGIEAARFREDGREYPLRVKLKDGEEVFAAKPLDILVPNANMIPVRLGDFASLTTVQGFDRIPRTNRAYSVKIDADIPPGVDLGSAFSRVNEIMEKEMNFPATVKPAYEGDIESLNDMTSSMGKAMGFGIILIFLVLASLYESFFIPIIIMLALPLAVVGSFVALLIAGQGIDMYSMIGMLMLLGVATKNSILLVDTLVEKLREQKSDIDIQEYAQLVLESCTRRLRPILMTSLALIAGMVPIAIGLNEASAQRTSLGTSVIGGVISSTALTLLLVPAFLMIFRRKIYNVTVKSAERLLVQDVSSSKH